MKDYDQDHLLLDVADALTLHREVQWDRCERLATPANRQVLSNLRALSGLLAAGRSDAGHARSRRPESKSAPLLLCGRLRDGILGRLALVLRCLVTSLPEHQRHALARAAVALAEAVEIAAVGRIVDRTARCGCGSSATLLVADEGESASRDLVAQDGSMAPLSRSSAIVYVLQTARGPLRVHRDDTTSLFVLLPPDDAAWSVESRADAVVPVPGPEAELLLGVLVVKRSLDDRVLRGVDLPFLEALDVMAGLAVARLRTATA